MKNSTKTKIAVAIVLFFVGALLVLAWTPKPVKEDQRVFMPGSQPGSASLESSGRCDNCHGQTYTYTVTAFVNCSDATRAESGYSTAATAVATR